MNKNSKFNHVFLSLKVFLVVLVVGLATANAQSLSDQDFLERCSADAYTARSKSCIQWLSIKAVQSFSQEPLCRDVLSVPLMMCIFNKEIGSFDEYYHHGDQLQKYCTQAGCGLSQMTDAGVWAVRKALKDASIVAAYEQYWTAVGLHDEAKNVNELTRRHAMNSYYGTIMAAIHLCDDAHTLQSNNLLTSPYNLGLLYNGHPIYKFNYAKAISECVQTNSWKENTPTKVKGNGGGRNRPESRGSEKPPEGSNKLNPDEEVFYNLEGVGVVKIKRSQIPKQKHIKYTFKNDPVLGVIQVPQGKN
jgi:hypothetical protein